MTNPLKAFILLLGLGALAPLPAAAWSFVDADWEQAAYAASSGYGFGAYEYPTDVTAADWTADTTADGSGFEDSDYFYPADGYDPLPPFIASYGETPVDGWS